MLAAGLFALEIFLLTKIYFYLIVKCNEDHNLDLGLRTQMFIGACSLIGGFVIDLLLKHWGILGQLSCGMLAAYLLTASITDIQTYEVYDFLAFITALAGIGILIRNHPGSSIPELLIFIVIQGFLFMSMYGRADGYAFIVCALFESRFGRGLLTYLFHMGLAFLLLGIVQGFLGNVSCKGNLKKSVAFLPYISITVWWFL